MTGTVLSARQTKSIAHNQITVLKTQNTSKKKGEKSKKTNILCCLEEVTNTFHKIGIITFKWHKSSKRLVVSSSKIRNEITVFRCGIHFTFMFYEIFQIMKSLTSAHPVYMILLWECLMTATHWICATSMNNFYSKGEDIVYMLNQIFKEDQFTIGNESSDEHYKRIIQNPPKIYLVLQIIVVKFIPYVTIIFAAIYIITLATWFPGNHFVADYIFPNRWDKIILSFTLLFVQMHEILAGAAATTFLTSIIGLYIIRNALYLKTARDEHIETSAKIKRYKELSVLNTLFKESCSTFAIPAIVVVTAMGSIIAFFFFIRFYGIAPIEELVTFSVVYVDGTYLFTSVLILAAKCFHDSFKTLAEMKTKYEPSKLIRKQIRSLRPYGIPNGPLRAIKHKHAYDTFEAIISILLTLLIEFPKL